MLDNNKSGGKRIDACMYFTFPPDCFQRLKFSLRLWEKIPWMFTDLVEFFSLTIFWPVASQASNLTWQMRTKAQAIADKYWLFADLTNSLYGV